MYQRHRAGGYSLYELLMTLGLAIVIFGLGLPSFGSLLADKRLRAETDALFHTIHLARQESIVRRRVVTICPSVDGQYCDADGRWSEGWILFANLGRSGSGRRDDDEAFLKYHRVGKTAVVQSNRLSYSFRSTQERATNGTLIVCDRAGRAATRAVIVSYTGRPRVARRDPRGNDYRCAD